MDARKAQILNTIIKEHIKTGSPVSSGILVKKYNLNISPATVRNEMAWLEHEDYIIQPHTSAGRVPTEKAYKKYIEELNKKNRKKNIPETQDLLENKTEEDFKSAAKMISQNINATVFWAIHKHNLYYTGISNLFQQPEFAQIELIYDISAVIDKIDEILANIFDELDMGITTMIGSENPFGAFCGTILVKYIRDDNIGLFGILGPMRMDYEKNLAIANYINEILNPNATN